MAAAPVTTCSAVTDAHLATITELDLSLASITSLKEGDFAGLSALTDLNLNGNQLSSLPAGVFSGLSALRNLNLAANSVDPLPVTVSLVSAGTGAFKATAHTGAPFNMVVPVSVTNGTIEGGVTTVTIPVGSVESGPLAVTRTPGATGALTVDIGTLPGLPPGHSGYARVKSADLPLTVEAEPVPAIPPLALLLLAFMLLASGAWLHRRRGAVASF